MTYLVKSFKIFLGQKESQEKLLELF